MTTTTLLPPRWDMNRDSVIFGVEVDGHRFRCVVSMEYLTAPFAKRLEEPEALRLFEERREEILARVEEAAAASRAGDNEIVFTTTGIQVGKVAS